jgi:hypothetical protein
MPTSEVGFSCWSRTFLPAWRGSTPVLMQVLFDLPTVDVPLDALTDYLHVTSASHPPA